MTNTTAHWKRNTLAHWLLWQICLLCHFFRQWNCSMNSAHMTGSLGKNYWVRNLRWLWRAESQKSLAIACWRRWRRVQGFWKSNGTRNSVALSSMCNPYCRCVQTVLRWWVHAALGNCTTMPSWTSTHRMWAKIFVIPQCKKRKRQIRQPCGRCTICAMPVPSWMMRYPLLQLTETCCGHCWCLAPGPCDWRSGSP